MGTWVVRIPVDADGNDAGPRLAVKDCIDMAGLPTTAGCPVVAEMAEPAHTDAAVVASAREGGARIVGKTSLTELCWSASGINHWAGTPVNPRDPRRLPGGSSSGSAVAVAMAEADVAFGTDTGGSVRVPAACCGMAGLKTTYGRVPVKGVYPLAPSLDTVGPLGRGRRRGRTRDAAARARVPGARLAGPAGRRADPGWTASARPTRPSRRRSTGPSPRPGVAVTRVPGWDADAAISAVDVLIDAEGFRSNAYLMPYLGQLSPSVRRNIERGARLTRADRLAAERTRAEVRAAFDALLADFPVLVLPTLLRPAAAARRARLPADRADLAGQPGRAARAGAAGARARRPDRVHAGDRRDRGAGASRSDG